MLGDAAPTAYDLRFQLFGFPIRVHPLFWLIMALLGDWTLRIGPLYLLLWVACGFVSILVHEMGHALAMRWFGHSPHIVLMAFGGYAAASSQSRQPWKRLLIALAGPLAGFTLLALAIGFSILLPLPANSPPALICLFLIWMNLFWNLFNLLPIWPLDGGHVCREVCVMLGVKRPEERSIRISMFVAGGIGIIGVLANLQMLPPALASILPFQPSLMMTLFMGMFAYQNYMLLQYINRQSRWN